MRRLDAGTVRHERRGLAAIAANLTVSLPGRHEPLIVRLYRDACEDEERDMRLIVTLTAALTILVLVLPIHP